MEPKKDIDLARWLSGELSAEEQAEFDRLPEAETYRKIKKFSSRLSVSEVPSADMLSNIISHKKSVRKRRLSLALLSAAAAVVILIGVIISTNTDSPTHVISDAGKTKLFQLPDGSEVVLNAGSGIKYMESQWEDDRTLELEGEALFTVTAGSTFEVITSLGKVKVLGTEFNVKARDDNFEIDCFHGKVSVVFDKKKLLLRKGETVLIQRSKVVELTHSELPRPAWMSGKIRFRKNSFTEITAEIERHYNVSIVPEMDIPGGSFTGALPSDDLNTALRVICNTYHLNFTYLKAGQIKLVAQNE